MAQTTGFVQLLIVKTDAACAWIGASPTNVEVLSIIATSNDTATTLAFKSGMVNALSAAMAGRRQVVATHGDSDATITKVQVNPA